MIINYNKIVLNVIYNILRINLQIGMVNNIKSPENLYGTYLTEKTFGGDISLRSKVFIYFLRI